MSEISKWTLFVRAFFVALIASQPAKLGGQSLSEDQLWRQAQAANNPQAYHGYLSAYPAGKYARDAIGALQTLGAVPAAPATRSISGGTSGGAGELY